jgi:hydroxymethylglutaryl-CoA lyase
VTNPVLVHEVGMRDGLQVEPLIVPTERKIAWIERLIASGVDAIQVGSFVNPKIVPQMADTDAICRHFTTTRHEGPTLTALVLNQKGLERGLAAGVRSFCMGVSASDTHSRRNTGSSTDDATTTILEMARAAENAGATVQLSVQSAFGCGYEGAIPAARVLALVRRFTDEGFQRLSLADTAGLGTPFQVRALFQEMVEIAPDATFACHFHDTYGLAMANAFAALQSGVEWFECAFGGLGGCPFTAVAGANLCTEDFVHFLERAGRRRDIALDHLVGVAQDAEQFFGRVLPGKLHAAGAVQA